VTGHSRNFHELHTLYVSPSIISMIEFGKIRWAGYVASMRVKVKGNIICGFN
jgi:hypothetical protein